MGDKTIADLISDNVSATWEGVNASVSGDIKYVDDLSQLFGDKEKSGNFFPFTLDSSFKGKEITVQRQGGVAATAADTDWIVRLTDGTSTKYDVTCEDTKIATFTFEKATLGTETGANRITIRGQSENAGYGSKLVSELMDENVSIEWDGFNGTVKGTFKKVSDWNDLPKDPYEGHFFVMDIDKRYLNKPFTFIKGDNESTSTVDSATEDEMFWVLRIDDTKKFTFKSSGEVIVSLDFSQATLSD